jgi:uncharacterized protein
MRVVVTGATGTIGRAVVRALRQRGDEVIALSRDAENARAVLGSGGRERVGPEVARPEVLRGPERVGPEVQVYVWPEPTREPPPASALSGADAVVHLLGETVAQRWTEGAKQAIRDSRELGTRMLVRGLAALDDEQRPRTLVSQSASGLYGHRGDEPLDEEAQPGSDFLAEVVVAWEREAAGAAGSMRVVTTRTGVVLSPAGGALGKMLPVFRLGIGGPVAGGRQYVPWIHLEDVVDALLFCLDSEDCQGPVNVTAPHPVTNAELSQALSSALGRPAILPVPGIALRILYGEMSEIVITGQNVIPARLKAMGFDFRYPEIGAALSNVVGGG